jgi:hypothetical protein
MYGAGSQAHAPSYPVAYSAQTHSAVPKAAPVSATQQNWPPSLRKFVCDAFAKCVDDDDRAYVKEQLKQKTTQISAEGRISTHDWAQEPMPLLCREAQNAKTPHLEHTSATSSVQPQPSRYAAVAESRYAAVAEAAELTGTTRGSKLSRKPRKNASKADRGISIYGGGFETGFEEESSRSPAPKATKNKYALVASYAEEEYSAQPPHEESKKAAKRAKRFQNDSASPRTSSQKPFTFSQGSQPSTSKKPRIPCELTEVEMRSMQIVGTCQTVEKEYFRLTSAPDPSTVRPLSVLQEALDRLKRSFEVMGEIEKQCEYIKICSQLKAIRQDLTVQFIQDHFTVDVYETHARVALECGDLNEYNQCQTQLKFLYASGYKGSEMEFIAYRILYYVYLQGNKKYDGGSGDLIYIIANLKKEAHDNSAVQHALQVRQAVQTGNYHRLFLLWNCTPGRGMFIIDLMKNQWRINALTKIIKGYRPSVSVVFVVKELVFGSLVEGVSFLVKAGCIFLNIDGDEIETRCDETGALNLEVLPERIDCKKTVVDTSVVFNDDNLLL